jgi:hypothetical protein
MRIGEVLALQAGDIDIDRRCIHIVRTWGSRTKAKQEHRWNSTKGKRDRLVDTSKQLTGMTKLHLAQKASPTEWVFPGKAPQNSDTPGNVPRPVDEAAESSRGDLPRTPRPETHVCIAADSEQRELSVCQGLARPQLHLDHRWYLRTSRTGSQQGSAGPISRVDGTQPIRHRV